MKFIVMPILKSVVVVFLFLTTVFCGFIYLLWMLFWTFSWDKVVSEFKEKSKNFWQFDMNDSNLPESFKDKSKIYKTPIHWIFDIKPSK